MLCRPGPSCQETLAHGLVLALVPNWDWCRCVRVVAISTLREFWAQPGRGDAREPLLSWYAVVSKATWASPAEVKAQFGNANIVGNNRAVFNVAGNKYRLIVAFAYRVQVACVKFVGTHAEYDKVDAATVDMSG